MDWLDTLAGLAEPCVLVTVASAEGSTPREAGAKMIVTAAAQHGTIGGGNLEWKALELARAQLASAAPAGPTFHRFPLGPSLGQCCGGVAGLVMERVDARAAAGLSPVGLSPVGLPPEWLRELRARRTAGEVLVLASGPGIAADRRLIGRRDAGCVAGVDGAPAFLRESARELIESDRLGARLVPRDGADFVLLERIAPADFHVVLFGAGHVGQAIVRVLGTRACRVTWVDEREAQFPADVPANVRVLWSDAPALDADDAPAETYFLVMTHSHALDQDICERVLRRADYAYLGLIGSGTKRAMFERRLAQRGIAADALARLVCPIGVPGIKSKDPSAIAVAVAAQLLQVREARARRAAAAGSGAAEAARH
jgi:xanthine dehydrogenase accessory factor